MAIPPSKATYEVGVDWRKGTSPPAGCVGWWRFDEGTGVLVADETGVNDGTAANMTWAEGLLPGGFAGDFNGINSRVNCGNNASLNLVAACTLVAFVKPSSFVNDVFPTIICKGGIQYVLQLINTSPGDIRFYIQNLIVKFLDTVTAPLQLDIPQIIWATYDGNTRRIFVDGAEIISDVEVGVIGVDAQPLEIGRRQNTGTQEYEGLIDEVRIYNFAMTPVQVAAEYAILAPITGDVKSVFYMRGRDTDLDRAEPSSCRIMVKDPDGKYVPENTASPLYGYLLPAKPVRVRATFGGTTYSLFNGYLDDVIPYPVMNRKEAFLPCVDGFDQLKRAKVSMSLQVDKKSGQLIGTALDATGWHAMKRTLDAGVDTYPLVHAERQPCLDFNQKLEISEFGFFYIGGDGYAHWEDRHHRLLAPHTASQWTTTPDLYGPIEPTNSLKSVRNNIILTAQPKVIAGARTDIWTLQENMINVPADSPQLEAGETLTYWATFADANGIQNIAGDVLAPVATTDYTGNDNIDGPPGANRTADVTVVSTIFSGSAKLEVTNGGATSLYLTLLKIRGKIYTDLGKLQITAEDAPSQKSYQLRDLKIDLPYYQGAAIMRGLANYQLAIKKEPIPGYRIAMVNKSDAVLTQILSRELSDRITLQSTELNIDDDFHIDKIEHEISDGGAIHRCRWTLTRADDYEYWILGISALGINTRLAF